MKIRTLRNTEKSGLIDPNTMEKHLKIFALAALLLASGGCGQRSAQYDTWELAEKVFRKGVETSDLGTYQGVLTLQGLAEMAVANPDPAFLRETEELLLKIGSGEIPMKGNFISYEGGGAGAAYYDYIFKGRSDVLRPQVSRTAERMMREQNRSQAGIMIPPNLAAQALRSMRSQPRALDGSHPADGDVSANDPYFVDVAFATVPFLLYAGLTEDRPEYIEDALAQFWALHEGLRDEQTGLMRQGIGFQGINVRSEDNWSRGSGWWAMAVASLVRDLPADHPQKERIDALARDFFLSVIRHQDPKGLWHQEMTDPTSFIETSGSGILLWGLGIMLEKGVLDASYRVNFERGLSELAAYVGEDGSVSHTCFSCRCLRQGLKEDYKNHVWILNDSHSFGPVMLAYAQAYKMGIRKITPSEPLGLYVVCDTVIREPQAYVRYVPERKQDVAWENDRIAFRVFAYPVRDLVGSGIDIFAKRVDYPIIDRWYHNNRVGLSYHEDRGEGCDFYDMGRMRGCGGLAILKGGRAYASETYNNHRVHKNTPEEIVFELIYSPWEVGGKFYAERKTIRMKPGTQFFEVTGVIDALAPEELTVGIGLTDFGKAEAERLTDKNALALWENLHPGHGSLGVAVIGPKEVPAGYAKIGSDHYLTLQVRTGEPFTYRVGAAWDKAGMYRSFDDWRTYVLEQAGLAY